MLSISESQNYQPANRPTEEFYTTLYGRRHPHYRPYQPTEKVYPTLYSSTTSTSRLFPQLSKE